MSCHCSGCSRSKRISTIRQLQPDVCSKRTKPVGSKTYPSKSNKVYKDRYNAARKWLIWEIERYHESYKRKQERIQKCMMVHGWVWIDKVWDCPHCHWHTPNIHARYVEYWSAPIKRNGWGVKKYRDARAECKKRGIL